MSNEVKQFTGSETKGEFRDTIYYADGRVEVTDWNRNLIVSGINNLISALFKNQSGYTGIGYWAVGSGQSSWDTNLANPAASDVKLVNEIGRKAIPASAITFLTSSDDTTSTVTNRLQITLTFEENDANGSWREFGIFGGNATSTKDSGVMINHKTHSVIPKSNSMRIERQIRFTFQ